MRFPFFIPNGSVLRDEQDTEALVRRTFSIRTFHYQGTGVEPMYKHRRWKVVRNYMCMYVEIENKSLIRDFQ